MFNRSAQIVTGLSLIYHSTTAAKQTQKSADKCDGSTSNIHSNMLSNDDFVQDLRKCVNLFLYFIEPFTVYICI